MPGFAREKKPARGGMISLRVTEDEKTFIEALAEPLGVTSQSDVLRLALDYFLANSPEAKSAQRSHGRKSG